METSNNLNAKTEHNYKRFGIILLILSLLIFLSNGLSIIFGLFIFGQAIFDPNMWALNLIPLSSVILMLIVSAFIFFDIIIAFWGIILAIIFIIKNKYNKQILWLIYSFVIIHIVLTLIGIISLIFIQGLSFMTIRIYDIVIVILVYLFLIKFDNNISRLIKNK